MQTTLKGHHFYYCANNRKQTRDNLSIEPHRDKTNEMACVPSKDSDQPGHLNG